MSTLRKGRGDWQQVLESLAELYVHGVEVDWVGFDRPYSRRKVELPTYPFQRQRYWIETKIADQTTTPRSVADRAWTPTMELLSQRGSAELVRQLEQGGSFSEEQRVFLTEQLEALARRHQQQLAQSVIQDWLYELSWQPQRRQVARNGTSPALQARAWLIFADRGGIGKALAERLEAGGAECFLVYPGDFPATQESGSWCIDPTKPEDFRRVLEEVMEKSLPLQGVVDLWGLESAVQEELTVTSLEQGQGLGCGALLTLLQSLAEMSLPKPPRMWVVTRGAVLIRNGSADGSSQHALSLSVAQAPLWGLGRVIALEHPTLWGGLLDLDPRDEAEVVNQLVAEITDVSRENQIAWRAGQRYVARLARCVQGEVHPIALHANAAYLITGGLGALGLEIAQWLVRRGARHIVLTGRRGAVSQSAQSKVKELEQAGIQVLVVKADVSRAYDVSELLCQIAQAMPPLRGVFHAAGVLDDGVLSGQSWERFSRVMAPKISGSWLLHSLTQELSLDFFVCFSSAASLLGSPGQGNYAAANAFMDGLVHYRRSLGLPGLSVNWGPWAESGMAAELGVAHKRRLLQAGMGMLSAQHGLQALEQLLAVDTTQAAVLPIDWESWESSSGALFPLLTDLVREPTRDTQVQQTFLQRLKAVPESERQELLEVLSCRASRQLARPFFKQTGPNGASYYAGVRFLNGG